MPEPDNRTLQTRLYLNQREVHDWIRLGWLDPSLVGQSVIVTRPIPRNHDLGGAIDFRARGLPDRIDLSRGPRTGALRIEMGDCNAQARHDGEVRGGPEGCLAVRARALLLLRQARRARRGRHGRPVHLAPLSQISTQTLLRT